MRVRSMVAGLVISLPLLGTTLAFAGGDDCPAAQCSKTSQPAIRIGAVAYAPGSVTVFEGIRRYFGRQGLTIDYVLFSNYDALVDALQKKQVDIAWNTPLAHAQYHRKAGNASQTLVMRDVDCNIRSALVVRADASIHSLDDLKGKTVILGSHEAAESTVMPTHFLKREGLDLSGGKVKILSLDREVDLRGNPCSSEHHVLKALQDGRGQAGIIGERLWKSLPEDQKSGLQCLWVSPPFSHCVFTASKDFDRALGDRFTKLMLAMDPKDPATADVMRLEGTSKWVAGSQDGFRELVKALEEEQASCSCCDESSAATPASTR
jgi:ABC-type phosphate/phosphonate transport system substrate-binding protein